MVATQNNPSTSHSKSELLLNGILFLLQLVLHMTPVFEYIIWAIIAGLSGHLIWESEWTKNAWPQTLKVIASICLAVFVSWQFLGSLENQKAHITNSVSTQHSRIVVSKFVIKPFNRDNNPNNGHQIDLHMINRGNIPGYAPVNNFSFKSVEKPPTDTEIEEEMGKVIKLALRQFPMRKDDREQFEVGVEHFMMLPSGITKEAYTMISTGQKLFYLFVVLTYYDDSLPMGQFWVSEFCGWQGKDVSYLQLCKGHNKTWLYKG